MAVGVACSDMAASVSQVWPPLLGTSRSAVPRGTPMTDTGTVLWTLHRGDNRLECSVERLPHGLQVHLAINGDTPYCSRTFRTQDELLAWAEEERVQTLADGWR